MTLKELKELFSEKGIKELKLDQYDENLPLIGYSIYANGYSNYNILSGLHLKNLKVQKIYEVEFTYPDHEDNKFIELKSQVDSDDKVIKEYDAVIITMD